LLKTTPGEVSRQRKKKEESAQKAGKQKKYFKPFELLTL
jgi:hypothetical protein